jgi:hypothetical protein
MQKLKVTTSTLIQRLNRALKTEGKSRQLRKRQGVHFVVSSEGARRIELEEFAREIGAIHPWEKL